MQDLDFISLVPHLRALVSGLEYKSSLNSHGSHSSIRKGYEDSMVDYRLYVQGDDMRFIDWKLYARTDKYYIREGYQKSRQNIVIWLDTSMSQRFDSDKFHVAWLLALSFAYLFKKQNDAVYLYLEQESGFANKQLVEIKGGETLIELDGAYRNKHLNLSKNTNSLASSMQVVNEKLKSQNKLIWISDLYLPLPELEDMLNYAFLHKWYFTALHLTRDQEWQLKLKKSVFSRIIDAENGDWIASNKVGDYKKIWEKSVNKRVAMLNRRGFQYVKGQIEDGPIKIIHDLKKL